MKKLLSFMILLAGVISFTSCSDDNPTYTAPAQLSLQRADAFFEAAGGTGSIVVNGSETITATSDANWVAVAVSGNIVNLTVAANNNLENRSANVLLKSATASKEVNITQRGIVYGIAEGNEYRIADAANSTVLVDVAQSAGVTVECLADWLTATFHSATGVIEIVAASNDAEKERYGLVALQTGNVKDTLLIVQDAFVFKIEKTALTMPSEGGVQTVAIEHSRPVTVEADVDWIKCSLNATADSIVVNVAENPDEARKGTITVKSSSFTKTITVGQEAEEVPLPTDPDDPSQDDQIWGTYTFYWAADNTYDLGNFTIEKYTGDDAEEGEIVLKDFLIQGSTVYGFVVPEENKLYIYAYQPIGTLTDPEYGEYGNLIMSISSQDVIAFDITPDGIVSTDFCVLATDTAYTQGLWMTIPTGGTTVFVKATAAARAAHRAAVKGGVIAKSRKNLPKTFKLFRR